MLIRFFIFSILIFFSTTLWAVEGILNYRPIFKSCLYKSSPWLQIREFESNGKNFGLFVHPETLSTQFDQLNSYDCQDIGSVEVSSRIGALLKKSVETPYPTFNDGIVESSKSAEGYFITVDLCPSENGDFEIGILDKIMQQSIKQKKPIPIGFAVTGRWLKNNQLYLKYLNQLEKSQFIKITWINHTDHHFYIPKNTYHDNFLIKSPWPIQDEVLELEKKLIEKDITPSIFFRFPGLVSNQSLMEKLKSLFLIPLGSNSWMAKKQLPKPGSIILLHGNGNESLGIEIFENWFDSQTEKINFLSLEKDLMIE
jgi:hypothetical protein